MKGLTHFKTKTYKTILTHMCDLIGVDPNEIDFSSSDWFTQHEWTEEQQENFTNWLTDFLMENKEAREDIAHFPRKDRKTMRETASWFTFSYGWKTRWSEVDTKSSN